MTCRMSPTDNPPRSSHLQPPGRSTHDQQAAQNDGSILPAPPDLAVAGDPLPVLPSWRGRGGLSMSRWNRPSSLRSIRPAVSPAALSRSRR